MCVDLFLPDPNENANSGNRKPLPFTCNKGYPKTPSAILKVFQAVFSLGAFAAACADWWTTKSFQAFQYFCFVTQWFMWSVVILYLLTCLNIHHRPCWPIGEFIFYIIATLCFFTSSVAAAVFAANTALTCAAVLGFCCVLLFAVGTYLSFNAWRKSARSQSRPENM